MLGDDVLIQEQLQAAFVQFRDRVYAGVCILDGGDKAHSSCFTNSGCISEFYTAVCFASTFWRNRLPPSSA